MNSMILMVHMELGRSNAGLLRVAGELAERFGANVIGIAGCQQILTAYNDGYVPGDVIVQVHDESKQEIKEAEAEFREGFRENSAGLEWRSTVMSASLAAYVASEARSADLVITGVNSGDMLNAARLINTGELLMQVGRPVLIVPAVATKLSLDHIVIAWNDTREARRAAFDALPLLRLAKHVSVVELAAEGELAEAHGHVKDVGIWLKRHGVVPECQALQSTGEEAVQLNAIAQNHGAGVIVAGAYGHSRLREFVFGGVTSDLLKCEHHCSFMSH